MLLARTLAVRLIAGMCDAIAELDETMCITSDAESLAALLLRQPFSRYKLTGACFLDLPVDTHLRLITMFSSALGIERKVIDLLEAHAIVACHGNGL